MNENELTLAEAARNVQNFAATSLRRKIAQLEAEFISNENFSVETLCTNSNIDLTLLASALMMKRAAGQINEVVHAVGILLLLTHILEDGEIIESLSLGAGNTGRNFDLETNLRVAEFKFIDWRGGAEAIRQNTFFKDFYLLAESDTTKQRYLYVIGDRYPLKFLHGKRALKSVMSKDSGLAARFLALYGEQFAKVHEYYTYRKDRVQIIDVTAFIPDFANIFDSSEKTNR